MRKNNAPPAEGVWSRGARTVSQAQDETGLSRNELWDLMNSGELPWFAHGGRGTRLVAWGALVDLLERWHAEALKVLKPKQLFFAYDTEDDLEPLRQAGRLTTGNGLEVMSKQDR